MPDHLYCSLHCKITIGDHEYQMLLGHGISKYLQHPLVRLGCLMRNNTATKYNSAAVVVQPNKWHKRQVVLVGPVRAIKNNNIAKILVVTPGLTIRPEQSLEMPIFINQVLKEKTRISLLPRRHVMDHRLSITGDDCFLLVQMAEVINVPSHAPNLVKSIILHAQHVHDFVFADPRSFHLYDVRFQLVRDNSV
jgi:hypothetical protein